MTFELPPYRIEWRPGFSTNWQLVGFRDNHDDARQFAAQAREEFNGWTRIITQHVIEELPSPPGTQHPPDMVPDE